MGAVTSGRLKLFGKVQRLTKVAQPLVKGALFRFPLNLIHEGEIIRNGAFDLDCEYAEEKVLCLMQIQAHEPRDPVYPYPTTALLLQQVEGPQPNSIVLVTQLWIRTTSCFSPAANP